jgi:hypothetical protein
VVRFPGMKNGLGTSKMSSRSIELRLARVVAVAASLALVTFMVVSTSRAAFTASTSNSGNTALAGTVALSDDDAASMMFALTDMTPDDVYQRCITVTYTGTPATRQVHLYRAAAVTGSGLDQYLDLDVEIGTGGSFGNCDGFTASGAAIYTGTLRDFATNRLDYASGVTTGWTPNASPQSRTFRVTLQVQDTNAAQGLNAGFGFTWESRN